MRELLAADVRLAFDSIMAPPPLPPLPPLASGNKQRSNDQGSHSWSAAGRGGAGAAGPGASLQQQQQQQPYQRLHFALWPIDDLLLEADAAIAAASWFPSSLTNLLPGNLRSSGGRDGSSDTKVDEVYGGSGATHSSHFFGLWPRAVPHLGHLGVWYRCVRVLLKC